MDDNLSEALEGFCIETDRLFSLVKREAWKKYDGKPQNNKWLRDDVKTS